MVLTVLILWDDLNQKLLLNSLACAFLLSTVCARPLTCERRVHAYDSSLVIHHPSRTMNEPHFPNVRHKRRSLH